MSSENRLAPALTGVFAALFGAVLVLSVAVASDQQLPPPGYGPVNVAVEAARWHAIAKKYLTEVAIESALPEETSLEEAIHSVESEIIDVNDYINYYFGGEGTTAEDPSFGAGDFSKAVPL